MSLVYVGSVCSKISICLYNLEQVGNKEKVPIKYKVMYNNRDRQAREEYNKSFKEDLMQIENGNRAGLIYDFI